MKKSLTIKLLGLAMLAAAGTAQASVIFHATLTHDQEVIAGGIPDEGSGGVATFVLNDAMTQLTYDVQLFGLDLRGVNPDTGVPGLAIPDDVNSNDNVTRLHIHRRKAGENGPIVFGMIDAAATMRNDNDPKQLVIDIPGLHITGAWDFLEGVPGVATLGTELDDLFRFELYINVHTSDHPGGEIRGQIVPEPGTVGLLALGLGGVLIALRRRRPD